MIAINCTDWLQVANMLYAFQKSNLSGKIIVFLLFVWSIIAWSVMVTKYRELRWARLETARFLALFRKESNPFMLFIKQRAFEASPVWKIYECGCMAVGDALNLFDERQSDLFIGGAGHTREKLSERQFETMRSAVDCVLADQSMLLEDYMGYLSTAVSTSPFLGLLGTVWGVMDAFGSMAVKRSASLSAVAPGISGALLTTVIALVVAIPSAVGYNILAYRIRRLQMNMENFSREFLSAVQRFYMQD